MATTSSLDSLSGTSSPASSVEMSRPAILQIGDIAHCEKEWSDLGSFADLKVLFLPSVLQFLRLTLDAGFQRCKVKSRFLKGD